MSIKNVGKYSIEEDVETKLERVPNIILGALLKNSLPMMPGSKTIQVLSASAATMTLMKLIVIYCT